MIKSHDKVASSDIILKVKQVIKITSLSQATIYRYLKDPESDFPPSIRIGAGRVGWRLSSIESYLNARELIAV